MQKIILNDENVSVLESMLCSEQTGDRVLALSMLEGVNWLIAQFHPVSVLIKGIRTIYEELNQEETYYHSRTLAAVETDAEAEARLVLEQGLGRVEEILERVLGKRVRAVGIHVNSTTRAKFENGKSTTAGRYGYTWYSWSALDDLIRFFGSPHTTELIQAFNRSRGDKREQVTRNGVPTHLQVIPGKYKNRPHGR